MTRIAAASRPVDVFARLTVDTPSGQIAVLGDGAAIIVRLDHRHMLRKLARTVFSWPREVRRATASQFDSALRKGGLRLHLHLGETEIASAGHEDGRGLLSRGLALPGVRVRGLRSLLALMPR